MASKENPPTLLETVEKDMDKSESPRQIRAVENKSADICKYSSIILANRKFEDALLYLEERLLKEDGMGLSWRYLSLRGY